VSTGALNDLEKVTKQAYASVAYFGLSKKLGNISFFDSSGSQEFYFTKPYSEKTAEAIDEEVRSIVEGAYNRAKDLIISNKDKVSQLAELLLEKEVIFREDVENIFGPRPWTDKEMHKQEDIKPNENIENSEPQANIDGQE
jgi:cell division protease FtsH